MTQTTIIPMRRFSIPTSAVEALNRVHKEEAAALILSSDRNYLMLGIDYPNSGYYLNEMSAIKTGQHMNVVAEITPGVLASIQNNSQVEHLVHIYVIEDYDNAYATSLTVDIRVIETDTTIRQRLIWGEILKVS